MSETIAPNTKIRLHFQLSLQDGSVIDSTRGKAAAEFVYGDGSLLPHFEKCLLGMQADQREIFTLLPQQAFGEYNPANKQAIPRTQFDSNMLLETGVLIGFMDANGEELPGLIKNINEQFVVVDFNHPLAGKEILFEADIQSVEVLDAERLLEWIEKRL